MFATEIKLCQYLFLKNSFPFILFIYLFDLFIKVAKTLLSSVAQIRLLGLRQ